MNTANTQQRGLPKRTRLQGLHSRLGGIDADLDPNTAEILKTFDLLTGELLLEFPPGSLPEITDYKDRPYDIVRDSGMVAEYSDTEASLLYAAEKLIAYSVIRDLAGLPPQRLLLHDKFAWSVGSAKFVNQEFAALMALAGVAWAAFKGDMPTSADLEHPLEILSKTPMVHYTTNEGRLPIAEVIKWRMSEALTLVNQHFPCIYTDGWLVSEGELVNTTELIRDLRCTMSSRFVSDLHRFAGITPYSLTVP